MMSRILEFLGLRDKRTGDDKGDLVSETIDLKQTIAQLSNNVRDLVVAVQKASDNPEPSRNPIEDMTRGRYRGVGNERR